MVLIKLDCMEIKQLKPCQQLVNVISKLTEVGKEIDLTYSITFLFYLKHELGRLKVPTLLSKVLK